MPSSYAMYAKQPPTSVPLAIVRPVLYGPEVEQAPADEPRRSARLNHKNNKQLFL